MYLISKTFFLVLRLFPFITTYTSFMDATSCQIDLPHCRMLYSPFCSLNYLCPQESVTNEIAFFSTACNLPGTAPGTPGKRVRVADPVEPMFYLGETEK